MRVLDIQKGVTYDAPDPPELPEWREALGGLTPPNYAEPVNFQPVEGDYFEARYGLKGPSVILQIKPAEGVEIDGDLLGTVLERWFNRPSFPGDWVEEMESWAIRIDDPPVDWDTIMMNVLQELEDHVSP